MRKILLALLIIVLIIFTGFVIYKGTSFGKYSVWGVTQISQKNDEIDAENEKLGGLVSVTYPGAIQTLNTSSETLEQTKKEYEEKAVLLADSKYYKQTEKYKVEFLWTKIGNYAKDTNVVLNLEVTNGTASGLYDLNFTANGKYADVAQFIYDIENDSRLGFKIENFKMISASATNEDEKTTSNTTTEDGEKASSDKVQGSFTCKEIRIDIKALDTDISNKANSIDKSEEDASTNTNAAQDNAVYNTSVKEVDNRKNTNEPSAGEIIDDATTAP